MLLPGYRVIHQFRLTDKRMYKEFYGFSAEPFALSPDPKFLYLAPSHFEAYSSMISGIKERKGVIVITGEVGVGKTILIYALLRDLSEKIKTAFLFQTRLDFKDMLKNILRDLEVPIGEKEDNLLSLMRQFRKYLDERLARDETVAIVIDEVQSLDDEVLKDLARLSSPATPSARLLQILLVGQPELEVKLNSQKLQPLRERIGVHRQIRPLTLEEGREYIAHRLKVVGGSVSDVFTPDAVDRVWKNAGGIPRVMNLFCDRALLIGYSDSTRLINSNIVKEAIKDFGPFQPRKLDSLPPASAPVKSHFRMNYRVLGILSILLIALGILVFALLSRDSGPPALKSRPALQIERKVLSPENRPMGRQEEKSIEVKTGWNLSLIARHSYPVLNVTLLDFILEANPQITDLNRILPRQKVNVPSITEESPLIRVSDHIYHIHLGTFKRAQNLRLYKDEPSLREKKIRIVPRKVSSKETWYRIVAGDFNTKEEALRSIQILKEKKLLPLLECQSKKTL